MFVRGDGACRWGYVVYKRRGRVVTRVPSRAVSADVSGDRGRQCHVGGLQSLFTVASQTPVITVHDVRIRCVWYDEWFALENLQARCQFNLAQTKKAKIVLNGNEMRETETEVLLCKKTFKNLEIDGCGRDRGLRRKAQNEGITITETILYKLRQTHLRRFLFVCSVY